MGRVNNKGESTTGICFCCESLLLLEQVLLNMSKNDRNGVRAATVDCKLYDIYTNTFHFCHSDSAVCICALL